MHKKTAQWRESPLNARIRSLISERGIKHNDFAEVLEISAEAVRLWCAGYARPDIDKIAIIANYFNVSIDYLFGKAECKKPKNEEISKRLGLSEETIKVLEKAKQEGKNRAVDNIIRAVANAL